MHMLILQVLLEIFFFREEMAGVKFTAQ